VTPTTAPTLTLRAKLVLLAFVLVIVPGGIFGATASRDAARALEATVGHQLSMVAGDVAGDLATALADQEGKVGVWTRQGVMREIIVGDVDKRIASFLQVQQSGDPAYLDLFVVDGEGRTVASSDPHLIGVSPPPTGLWREAIASRAPVLNGPVSSSHDGRRVLELAAPIVDPENAGAVLGALFVLYDWTRIVAIAAEVHQELAATGLAIDLLILDGGGVVIGSAGRAREGALVGRNLAADGWHTLALPLPDRRNAVYEPEADAFVGRVHLAKPAPAWTVLALQSRTAALAPIDHMRRRLFLALAVVLTAGVVTAAVVARRMTQPLRSLTEAARDLARGSPLPPLPVRSRDEIGELTAAFNAMTADLRQAQHDLVAAAKLASVGEIAAGLAHEIRTPLGIMRGSAQMLGRALGDGNPKTGELVNMIVGEVDRLERVVAALTELGRPHEPSIEETLLAPLLTRAIEFVGGQAMSQHVVITQHFERPCLALCDPEQLYQVALNLLVNALHVLPAGGHIAVQTFPAEHGRVGFEIVDDGPGIAPELHAEIFTPFFTRREGGTGLGLAFVERVVVAHQGRVSVQSTLGAGARFRIELPAAEGRT
jgi:two-component system, NtrC family, sensor histidine kinase HydH